MTLLSSLRRLLTVPSSRPASAAPPPPSCRPWLEVAGRTHGAVDAISVANASLNEIGNVSAFVASGSGGLSSPKDLVLGPDGNVYVASAGTNSVIRYTPDRSAAGHLRGGRLRRAFRVPTVWRSDRTATSTWTASEPTPSANTAAARVPS